MTARIALALLLVSAPAAAEEYAWHPTATDHLDARFAAPAGFTRDAAPEKSFAAFLRSLPLLPADAKVVDYRGTPLYQDGHHPNIAAVVDLDVGTANLQQCADAIIRLDAEWRYGAGKRDHVYKAASGTAIPYARYVAGERVIAKGKDLTFVAGPGGDSHEHFRRYLDDVFGWANTGSLERDAKKVTDLRAGDFFVMSGAPFGHAVIVLDVARDAQGRRALLLGQSYMPAQSFHVLRPSAESAWFVLEKDATELKTPFWAAFPMTSLRRL